MQSHREGWLLFAVCACVAMAAAAVGLIAPGIRPVALTAAVIFGLIAAGILVYLLTRHHRSAETTAPSGVQAAVPVMPQRNG
jgi:hypothetical protein